MPNRAQAFDAAEHSPPWSLCNHSRRRHCARVCCAIFRSPKSVTALFGLAGYTLKKVEKKNKHFPRFS